MRFKVGTRARRLKATRLLAAILLSSSFPAISASLYTETFGASTGGWTNEASGAMTVAFSPTGNPGGSLHGFFSASPFFPFSGAFIATGQAASVSFVGDYANVDAWLLGFDFMAGDIIPSDLRVYLYSTTNFIYRPVDLVIETGKWYSVKIPLLDASSGGWVGDIAQFDNIVADVSKLEIFITRNDFNAQSYFVDNVFLDRLPDAVEVTETNMVWLHFRNGVNYQFQASTNLNGPTWTDLGSFTATASVYNITVPATNELRYYRIMMD